MTKNTTKRDLAKIEIHKDVHSLICKYMAKSLSQGQPSNFTQAANELIREAAKLHQVI